MSRTFIVLLVATLTLVITMLTAGFFFAFERAEETVPGQPSGLARRNPYLALERLFTRTDIEATTFPQLPKDPYRATKPNEYTAYDADTIIWMTPKRDIDPIQLQKMHGWVSIGRHLIVIAPHTVHDPLITAFGLDFNNDHKTPNPNTQSSTYTIENRSGNTLTWKNPRADYEFYDKNQSLVAHSQPYEDGRLTFFASASIFTNQKVGEDDHAQLVLDLANLPLPNTDANQQLDDEARYISIVIHGQRTSWIMHIVTRFWPFFATLAVLLLLALANGRRRFGPLQISHAYNNIRRSRLEHIHAVGRFLWKNSSEQVLLDATRDALLEKLARRRPAIKNLTGNHLFSVIAEELNLTGEEARDLFNTRVPTQPKLFLDLIKTFENYRRAL